MENIKEPMTCDTGLGFRVCNRLLRGLNGQKDKKIAIDIESKLNEGTAFIIRFVDMIYGSHWSALHQDLAQNLKSD